MERQFRINWQALIEEAKQRRKSQNLTQRRLAILAKVSTPTISRFERGEKDIQLSSVLNIFGVLGMLDERQLTFTDHSNAFYDHHRDVVVFLVKRKDKGCNAAFQKKLWKIIMGRAKIYSEHF